MILKINGKEQDMAKCDSLLELIDTKKLNRKTIVVEHNHMIVPKERWHEVILNERDNIEIVSFVGGG